MEQGAGAEQESAGQGKDGGSDSLGAGPGESHQHYPTGDRHGKHPRMQPAPQPWLDGLRIARFVDAHAGNVLGRLGDRENPTRFWRCGKRRADLLERAPVAQPANPGGKLIFVDGPIDR